MSKLCNWMVSSGMEFKEEKVERATEQAFGGKKKMRKGSSKPKTRQKRKQEGFKEEGR